MCCLHYFISHFSLVPSSLLSSTLFTHLALVFGRWINLLNFLRHCNLIQLFGWRRTSLGRRLDGSHEKHNLLPCEKNKSRRRSNWNSWELLCKTHQLYFIQIMTSNTWNLTIIIFYFLSLSIFTVLAITTHANGDDRSIDTRDGEDLNLQCRFNKEYSNVNFIYYWARSSQSRFENVAISEKSLSSNYM